MATTTGHFDVEMEPQNRAGEHGVALGRMGLRKTYRGGLAGTSAGTMLTAMTPVSGSADYLAFEQFTGTLDGRRGSFVLAHHGRMHGEVSELRVSVVPDSATDALVGLRGTTAIGAAAEGHPWTLTYEGV